MDRMYTAVIVDDEDWALTGAMHTFPFAEAGFLPILSTTDSSEAAAFLLQKAPDLVIADIRMPEVTGLELLKRARERELNSLFVLLTGYSEFAYAREAVSLGAFEYCLKPLRREQAQDVLLRAARELARRTGQAEREDGGIENAHFRALVRYIGGHFTEPLQQGALCERFGIHPSYCSRLFTRHLGASFPQYLGRLRLNHAKGLLLSGNYTVAQSAELSGFTDYYYFNKVYTRCFGISPAKTRKAAFHGR